MDTVMTADVRELISANRNRCVSIYMPTYPRGRDGQQDSVRLKNLVAAAERELIHQGMRSVDARAFVAPILDLQRHPEWERRKAGLAVFHSNDKLVEYWLDLAFEEKLVVGPRFYIRPLLPALGVNPRFILLAISRNQVRILKCAWGGFERLSPERFPANMEQALNLQTADRGEQVHSGMRGDLGKEAGVFHGQGGHADTLKEESAEYFRLVDQALRPISQELPWPVILAGVDYEVAIYRAISENAQIADKSLLGSFDYASDQQLYDQALPIARRVYGANRQKAFARYRTMLNRTLSTDEVEEIIPAAHEGRIDTLFVDNSAALFGRYDAETRYFELVQEHEPMCDLVELTITQTLRHRGIVIAASHDEMPAVAPMCAILRY